MKLQIGENLKRLRYANGVTQERLADALGVSCQSVSRWESGVCYPDLELLPAIANFFDITLDELVGMAAIRSEEKRRDIFTATLKYEAERNWTAAAAVLKNALKTYPLDDGLAAELALVLSKIGSRENQLEAISLSETVLKRCSDEKLRSTLRANLCFLYKSIGQVEKAAELGRTLPHIWECREVLLPDLVPEPDRPDAVNRMLNVVAQVLHDVVSNREISFSLGYKPDARVDTSSILHAI